GGGYICDTPGFSKVDFEFHDATMIKNYFLDFKKYSDDCKFGYSCQHISEPDCMVKSKVASGDILKSRYESYLNFVDILKTRKEKF
ncbi:MAG TPA: ribosome small subunit-dependent GTPase, partial [Acholeplasmataceae bacterium]|nr:ribosome small subunit-dependent GTPase [Acholeplasmataceae bacterium]